MICPLHLITLATKGQQPLLALLLLQELPQLVPLPGRAQRQLEPVLPLTQQRALEWARPPLIQGRARLELVLLRVLPALPRPVSLARELAQRLVRRQARRLAPLLLEFPVLLQLRAIRVRVLPLRELAPLPAIPALALALPLRLALLRLLRVLAPRGQGLVPPVSLPELVLRLLHQLQVAQVRPLLEREPQARLVPLLGPALLLPPQPLPALLVRD